MDHSGHDMAMGTATTSAMAAAATGKPGGHSMGGNGCKISMLFNLNTIDACFLSSQWKITSAGMFAGSCIGVFLLTMVLEFLRRSIKEYDRFLVRQHLAKHAAGAGGSAKKASPGAATESISSREGVAMLGGGACSAPPFRPNIYQQAVRAFLHFLAFFVGYILMLLAMYYNGYILICIFLGAFFGAFVFQWETLTPGFSPTSAAQETTLCCG